MSSDGMSTVEQIAEGLDQIRLATILRASKIGPTQTVVTIKFPTGETLTAVCTWTEYINGQLPPPRIERAMPQLKVGKGNAKRVISGKLARQYQEKQFWSISELKDQALPLYWNKEWLEQGITEYGTISALAIANGYKINTLYNWVNRHEINLYDNLSEAKESLLAEWRTTDPKPSQADLARKYEINPGTVAKWIRIDTFGLKAYEEIKEQKRKKLAQAKKKILELWDNDITDFATISRQTGLSSKVITTELKEHRNRTPNGRYGLSAKNVETKAKHALAIFDNGERVISTIARKAKLSKDYTAALLLKERNFTSTRGRRRKEP
jgi:transposase-like protein